MTVAEAEQALREALDQQAAARECLEVARVSSLARGGSKEDSEGIVAAESQLRVADVLVETRQRFLTDLCADVEQAERVAAREEYRLREADIEAQRAAQFRRSWARILAILGEGESTQREIHDFLDADAVRVAEANDAADRAQILDRVEPLDDGLFRTAIALLIREWLGRPELELGTTQGKPDLERALSRIGGGLLTDVEKRLEHAVEAFAGTTGASVLDWLRAAPDPDAAPASSFALRVPFAQDLIDRYCPEEEAEDANAAE